MIRYSLLPRVSHNVCQIAAVPPTHHLPFHLFLSFPRAPALLSSSYIHHSYYPNVMDPEGLAPFIILVGKIDHFIQQVQDLLRLMLLLGLPLLFLIVSLALLSRCLLYFCGGDMEEAEPAPRKDEGISVRHGGATAYDDLRPRTKGVLTRLLAKVRLMKGGGSGGHLIAATVW